MLARINRNYVPAYWDDFFNDSFFNSCNDYSKKEQSPSVNVIESDENFTIQLAAPGVSRKDLRINIEDDILSISFEHQEKKDKNETNYLRREFVHNSFKRNFRLPETIDTDKVAARHENGVLIVELPKKEEMVQKISRQIEVN